MRRSRQAKIVATLGPATSTPDAIKKLLLAGADVFRLNFSHGHREDHAARLEIVRALEQEIGRPIAVIADLQGPKLRVGQFDKGEVELQPGSSFRLDLNPDLGNASRVMLPHPELFEVLREGVVLLLDDGKLRLRVAKTGQGFVEAVVEVGGRLSNGKGMNIPSITLPLSSMTARDQSDLDFCLQLGVDWVALSFVQRAEDITEVRAIVRDRALLLAKIEKPSAVERLDGILEVADAVMIARGDLGVELPPEEVPVIQRKIVRACRSTGRPVIVATQMLESMVFSPVPTRAEVSDVATAIYDGCDAVMLSAESARGSYPTEAVSVMDTVIRKVEADPCYRHGWDSLLSLRPKTHADAICSALRQSIAVIDAKVTVSYTESGYTSIRASRERPAIPILGLTPSLEVARRLSLVWGVRPVLLPRPLDAVEIAQIACEVAVAEGCAGPGDDVILTAGVPFGISGTTNMLRIVTIPADMQRHASRNVSVEQSVS